MSNHAPKRLVRTEKINKSKIPLFITLFERLSEYYGSDIKLISRLGTSKNLRVSMYVDNVLYLNQAKKILDHYNKLKAEGKIK